LINKNYTIPLLGGVAIVCASTWTIAGTVISLIVLLFLIDQMILGGKYTKYIHRKLTLRKTFDVFHILASSNNPDNGESACTIYASPDKQRVKFTIQMRKELTMGFIRLEFKGEGEIPIIEDLYDWYIEDEVKPHNVIVKRTKDGGILWEYTTPKPRFKDSNTTIGIKCLARDSFEGVLDFRVTFNEIQRMSRAIPFKVKQE
jgi:hypothetical protein